MIQIVVADDHELIRKGIRKIISRVADMRVVGEAADFDETVRLVTEHRPDIVTLDISMPGQEGLNGLALLRKHFPDVRVLVLSTHPEDQYAVPALRAGAAGYINKGMAAEEVVRGIRKIWSDGCYVSPRLAELLAMDVIEPRSPRPHELLAPRELQILRLLGAGRPMKQVAAELSISISSVNTYRARIFRKMGLSSNAGLIRYVIEHGLIG